MKAMIRLFLLILALVPITGCEGMATIRNSSAQGFADTRLARLRGELNGYYDRLEQMEATKAYQTRLGPAFDSTCFSRRRGESVCTEFTNQINNIFADPLESVTLSYKYSSFNAYMAKSHATWQQLSTTAASNPSQSEAVAHGLPRDLYDQGIEYYRLVDSALGDISQKAAELANPQNLVKEEPMLGVAEGGLFLLAATVLWFMLKARANR